MFSYFSSFFRDHSFSHQAHFQAGTAVTTAGVATTGLFWGLHMSDIYMGVSCIAAICGVVIQLCVAIHNIRNKK